MLDTLDARYLAFNTAYDPNESNPSLPSNIMYANALKATKKLPWYPCILPIEYFG